MVIILDANIYGGREFSNSLNFKVLFKITRLTSSKLILPYVVYKEAINLRRVRLGEILDAAAKLNRLARINGVNLNVDGTEHISIDEKFISRDIELYSKKFENGNSDFKFEIDKNTAQELEESIDTIVSRKPPSKNGDGYRDVLIWLTVKRYVKEGNHVIFITENSADFSEKDDIKKLNSFLSQEIEALKKINSGNLTYSNSLKSFTDELFIDSQEEYHVITDALSHDKILEIINHSDEISEKEIDEVLSLFYDPLASRRKSMAYKISTFSTKRLSRFADNLISIDAEVIVSMILNVDTIEVEVDSDVVLELTYELPIEFRIKISAFIVDGSITEYEITEIKNWEAGESKVIE